MKKILVTGADGFIGSHLCENLIDNGFSVRALTLYNSFNSWGWLDQSKKTSKMEIISGDIRDESLAFNITKNCDCIINLAALIAIPYSYEAPGSYIDTNVKGTLNMLNASIRNKIKLFIQTSTSEVYGTAQEIPISENHPLNPQSPYAASKVASDNLALSYYYSFNLPVVIARPFNTFGPRQSLRAIIPNLITQLVSKKKDVHVGNLDTTRDFNYVGDTTNAFISIINNYQKCIGEVINIGSGFEIPIKEIYVRIAKIINKKKNLVIENQRLRPSKSEVFRLVCNNQKLVKLTNWRAQNSGEKNLVKGLIKSIKWYQKKENIIKFKTSIYNR